jgi:hypothetical protein
MSVNSIEDDCESVLVKDFPSKFSPAAVFSCNSTQGGASVVGSNFPFKASLFWEGILTPRFQKIGFVKGGISLLSSAVVLAEL